MGGRRRRTVEEMGRRRRRWSKWVRRARSDAVRALARSSLTQMEVEALQDCHRRGKKRKIWRRRRR